MGKRDVIALDTIDTKRGSIKQQIDNMIIEQVDLIYVEETTIGCRQQSWGEVADASCQCCCKIKATGNTIFAGIERERYQVHWPLNDGVGFLVFVTSLTFAAHPLWGSWITEVRAVGNAGYGRKQAGEGAYSRGFACTSTSADENTTNRWIDGVEDEGKPHFLLPNHSAQRECCHVPAFVAGSTLCRVGYTSLYIPSLYLQTWECCMLSQGCVKCQNAVHLA